MTPPADAVSRLILGTATFGLTYGVTNTAGLVAPHEIRRILDFAASRGICLLDTAQAYGEAETAVGDALGARSGFRAITKLKPLDSNLPAGDCADDLLNSIGESCRRLRCEQLYGLLLHRPADVLGSGSADVTLALQEAKRLGLAQRIGFSAYDIDEAVAAARVLKPDLVQLPMNVFDQRLLAPGALTALRELAADGCEIRVRSVFLQGVALVRTERLPAFLGDLTSRHAAFSAACAAAGISPAAACLQFALEQPFVSRVIVGTTSYDELVQLCDAAGACADLQWHDFATDDEQLIDPRQWTAAQGQV